ncbi:MAG: helix-turn-helix domain-containing protein [Microbacterium sp.]|nr:helix-turn-helix domain-containing protein [Microbacterium sp.]
MKTVATLVSDGLAPFEFGVSCELWGIDRSAQGGPKFEHRIVAERPGAVRTNQGFSIHVEQDLAAAEDVDLLVLPATWNYGQYLPTPAVIDLIHRTIERGARIMTVCSGTFTLAHAGVLDGRRATTHWMYAERLAREFPRIRVEPDVLFVDDGPILTSAGTAAGIDAGLYLIRKELGAAAANIVARRMVVPPHRDGGQSQFILAPVPRHVNDSLAPVVDWMLANLGEDMPVERLAGKAHMSPRTFARRFRAEIGATPAAWLNRQRLARAQELLEQTERSVDAVAVEAGFGSGAVMRHHFTKVLQTTPAAYRATFSYRVAAA